MLKVNELGNEIPALAGAGETARAATLEPHECPRGHPGSRGGPCSGQRGAGWELEQELQHGHIPALTPVLAPLPPPAPACPRGCPSSLGQQSLPSPSVRRDPICPRAEAVGTLGLVPPSTGWGWGAQGYPGRGKVLQPSQGIQLMLREPPVPCLLRAAPSSPSGTRSGWGLPQGSGCQRQQLLLSSAPNSSRFPPVRPAQSVNGPICHHRVTPTLPVQAGEIHSAYGEGGGVRVCVCVQQLLCNGR